MHTCPAVSPTPHIGGAITGIGCLTVLIAGQPAATTGDVCTCVGPPDVIMTGSSGVFIGGKPAARMGDTTAHGGVIVGGCTTVLIGEKKSKRRFYKEPDQENAEDKEFIEPTEGEKIEIIRRTLEQCKALLLRKIMLLTKRDASTIEHFKKWLGRYDELSRTLILRRMQHVLRIFEDLTEHNFVRISNDKKRRKSYALVIYDDPMHTIYLGDLFWKFKTAGKDTKVGTLLHEVAHFDGSDIIDDQAYGVDDCIALAKSTPEDALYNADSFQYFMES
jgi:uncharacterized Zn-binding protein involved in type VI secretion